MSIFSSLLGPVTGIAKAGLSMIGGDRAGNAINNTSIAAEHGVLDASGSAIKYIQDALNRANNGILDAGNSSRDDVAGGVNGANTTLAQMLERQNVNLQPYLGAGERGVKGLSDYVDSKPTFSFNPTDLENEPGFQFQKEQGEKAITNNMAAQGLASSGSALKELTKFGQGLAGTYYQQAFDRAKSTFDTNQNTTLSNLMALTNTGEFGTQQFNGVTTNAGNQQAGNIMSGSLFNAGTGTDLSKYLASLNVGGAAAQGQAGMTGAKQAGDFAVGGSKAKAAGILNEYDAMGDGLTSLASLIQQIQKKGRN